MQKNRPLTRAKNDIENRRPVWLALSNLFLDTELQEYDLQSIARTLAESPYSLSNIETILYREVYPVCIANFSGVAGEWAGFNPQFLEESILRSIGFRGTLGRLFQPRRWLIRDEWQRVQDLYLEQLDLAEKKKS